jgi:hypothetical protein
MRTKDFIGKALDVTKIEMLAFASYFEKTFERPVIEIDLQDFEHEADTDKAGFNGYSLRVELTGNRITAIKRIGHRGMDGDQSGDDELSRFPHRSLEAQAQERLRIVVTELSPSAPD